MQRTMQAWLAALFAAAMLGGCNMKAATLPSPLEPTASSVSHFCGMLVVEHPGPKGQIFLQGQAEPVWFSSVAEAVAYTMLPDEPAGIVAIYVNDMGKAKNWNRPDPGAWVEARRAWYVLGSDSGRAAGMGDRREPIPFSDRSAAENYRTAYGGRIVRFNEIPEDEILGSGSPPDQRPDGGKAIVRASQRD